MQLDLITIRWSSVLAAAGQHALNLPGCVDHKCDSLVSSAVLMYVGNNLHPADVANVALI